MSFPIVIQDIEDSTCYTKCILVGKGESWDLFRELVQRGANLWPDAPPEIKEFADLVTSGKILQDYRAQAGKTGKTGQSSNSSKAKTD